MKFEKLAEDGVNSMNARLKEYFAESIIPFGQMESGQKEIFIKKYLYDMLLNESKALETISEENEEIEKQRQIELKTRQRRLEEHEANDKDKPHRRRGQKFED